MLLSILCVLLGVFVIAVRAPMVLAPGRSTSWLEEQLLSTDGRVRGLGLFLLPFGVGFVFLTRAGEHAPILHFLGWWLGLAALWLLVAPASYRRMAVGVMGLGADWPAVMRGAGLLGVAIGLALVYAGWVVVG